MRAALWLVLLASDATGFVPLRAPRSLPALRSWMPSSSSEVATPSWTIANQTSSNMIGGPTFEELPAAPSNEVNQARLLLLGAAALYGTNFSLVKLLGETQMPIGLSTTLRFGMAALVLSPFLRRSKATLAGFEVGLWNSIGYVAQAVGLATTAASKSAFLCSLAVVVVPLLDFATGQRLLPRQSIGALLALAGVGFLELGDVTDVSFGAGDVASLIQPFAFGIGFWRMEQAMRQYPESASQCTAGQLLAVFLGSTLYAFISDPASMDLSSVATWLHDPQIWFALFWTGCITTALTIYMETLALKTLSAAETTLIFSTEPLWGTAFAAAVMGEQLGLSAGLGALLILSGCLWANLGMDGVKALISRDTSVEDVTSVLDSERVDGDSFDWALCSRPKWTLLRSGTAVTMGSALASVWNDLSVGGRVLAIQLQDLLDQI